GPAPGHGLRALRPGSVPVGHGPRLGQPERAVPVSLALGAAPPRQDRLAGRRRDQPPGHAHAPLLPVTMQPTSSTQPPKLSPALVGAPRGAAAPAIACGPGGPASPTWAEDAAPILAANCGRCHTVPAIGGAPSGFRLDIYDDWVGDDGAVIRGAGTMAQYV